VPPDYQTANGPDTAVSLDELQRSNLYAELASGAESGKYNVEYTECDVHAIF
jgi:hypothetical protein